jgi:hypothetical protein
MAGVPIEWSHPSALKSLPGILKMPNVFDKLGSIAGAKEMIDGFGLAVPPYSTQAPSLTSNHIAGKAIDMDINWIGTLKVKKKDGTVAEVPYVSNPNANVMLHQVGASYGVKKLTTDKPHWSYNGR